MTDSGRQRQREIYISGLGGDRPSVSTDLTRALGLRHPEMLISIGSTSGALSCTPPRLASAVYRLCYSFLLPSRESSGGRPAPNPAFGGVLEQDRGGT